MTGDLTTRLERALHTQETSEAGLRPDAAVLADLHARVDRGRRGRTTRYLALAAATVGVLGLAGWFGVQHRSAPVQPAPPAPTATVAPSPSPSPSPDPSATPTPPPLEQVSLAGLPPMFRAPDGILEQTGPGWYVVAYGPEFSDVPEQDDGRRNSLVLSAPGGELYHLGDTEDLVVPVRWAAPGTVRAVVWAGDGRRAASVDLRTAEVTVDDRLPVGARWLGTAGADEVWSAWSDGTDVVLVVPPEGPARQVAAPADPRSLSPDGRHVTVDDADGSLDVLDVTTGRTTTPAQPDGQRCQAQGWFDADRLLAVCFDLATDDTVDPPPLDLAHGRVVRLDLRGGPPVVLEELRSDSVVPADGAHVADGVVAAVHAPLVSGVPEECRYSCYGDVSVWEGGTVTPVAVPEGHGQACDVQAGGDGLLLWTSSDECWLEGSPREWWTTAVHDGTPRLIAPNARAQQRLGPLVLVEREG